MTPQDFKKISAILIKAYTELAQKASANGMPLDSNEYDRLQIETRNDIIANLGFKVEEYINFETKDLMLASMASVEEIKAQVKAVDTKVDGIQIPTQEDIVKLATEIAQAYVKPPQITNQIIKEITVKEPTFHTETKVEQITNNIPYDDTVLSKSVKDLRTQIENIKIPEVNIEAIKSDIKLDFGQMFQKNIDILGMPDFRKLAMGLRGDIDDLRHNSGGAAQTPWTSDINGAGFNLTNVGIESAGQNIATTAISLGSELLTNGDFSSATLSPWTGTGWTRQAGGLGHYAKFTQFARTALTQTQANFVSPLVIGKAYQLMVGPDFGGVVYTATIAGNTFVTDGTNAVMTFNFVALSSAALTIFPESDGSGANGIAQASIKQLIGGSVASEFISTAPIGTPPLQVNSTTKVDNLNASLLEGHPASYFATAGGAFIEQNPFSATYAYLQPQNSDRLIIDPAAIITDDEVSILQIGGDTRIHGAGNFDNGIIVAVDFNVDSATNVTTSGTIDTASGYKVGGTNGYTGTFTVLTALPSTFATVTVQGGIITNVA